MVLADLLKIFYSAIFVWMAEKIHAWTGFPCSPPVALVIIAYALVMMIIAAGMVIAKMLKRCKRIVKNEVGATGKFAKFFDIWRYLLPGRGTIYTALTVSAFSSLTVSALVLPDLLAREPFIDFTPTKALLGLALSVLVAVVVTEYAELAENHPRKFNHFLLGGYLWLVFTWQCIVLEEDRSKGIIVIGPTGSGKTSSYLINNVVNDAKGNGSCVVIDRKTDEDIIDIVGRAWNEEGKPVLYYDPYGRDFHYNPLLSIDPNFKKQATFDAIGEIAGSIFQGYTAKVGDISADAEHHQGIEERLLRSVIMCVLTLPVEYKNLPTVLDVCKLPPDGLTNAIALSGNQDVIDEYSFFPTLPSAQKVNALQGLVRKLQFLDSPSLRANLIRSDLDLDMVFQKPCLFIMKAPLNRPDIGILASMIIRLLQIRHYAYAARCKHNKTQPRLITYHLDEFPHLNVPNMHAFATTIRSSNGAIVLYVHDLEDLRKYMEKFKHGSKEGLEASLRTWVILPGCGPKMCMEISKSLGEITLQDRVKKGKDTYSCTAEKRALETHDNLHYMKKSKCLVLRPGETRPFYCKQIPYYRDRQIKHLLYGKVEYYKPKKIEQIVQGRIADLIKKRASDVRAASCETDRATESQTSLPNFDYISGASEQRKCNKCGKPISKTVADYCTQQRDRFGGKKLCIGCQREY